MWPSAWLQIYRLAPWRGQEPRARLLLYAALGYAVAGGAAWRPLALNTLAILGLVMFQAALNDYWDTRLQGERTFIGHQLERGALRPWQVQAIIGGPLLLLLPMVALALRKGCAVPMIGCFAAGLVLAAAYSQPPVRLKRLRPWGLVVAPTLTALMTVEAYLVQAPWGPLVAGLAVLVWLFQLYAELLKVVAMSPRTAWKCSPRAALRTVRVLPWCSGAVALAMTPVHPVFSLSLAAATVRVRALAGWRIRRTIAEGRLALGSRVLCLYEFAGYAIFGLVAARRW